MVWRRGRARDRTRPDLEANRAASRPTIWAGATIKAKPPIQALLNWLYIFIDTTNPMAVMNCRPMTATAHLKSPFAAAAMGGSTRIASRSRLRALLAGSARMPAYPRISQHILAAAPFAADQEVAAKRPLLHGGVSEAGFIAMQKVVGSNPISRFHLQSRMRRPGGGVFRLGSDAQVNRSQFWIRFASSLWRRVPEMGPVSTWSQPLHARVLRTEKRRKLWLTRLRRRFLRRR